MAIYRSSEIRLFSPGLATPEEAAAIAIALSVYLDSELNVSLRRNTVERWRRVGRLEAHGRKLTDRAIALGWRG